MSKTRKNASNNKKSGDGNGNSVINNTEKIGNYVSGDTPSSSSHQFNGNTKNQSSNPK